MSTLLRDNLQQILSVSKRIAELLPPTTHQATVDDAPTLLQPPPLRLVPLTSRFRSDMIQAGLSLPVCEAALIKATELALYYERSFERVCRDISTRTAYRQNRQSSNIIEKLRNTYESLFEKRDLPRFLDDAMKAFSAHRHRCNVGPSVTKRPVFNHQYTPFLEKCFEHNAYPSKPDQLALARKTSMTPRQIEVWFQNHRNRAKKEGTILRKALPGSFPLDFEYDTPGRSVPSNASSHREQDARGVSMVADAESSDDETIVSRDNSHCDDPFSFTRPPHAFPTPFPYASSEDPFPRQNGVFKFPIPAWARTRATAPAKAPRSSVDMDAFVDAFASKLHLRDGVSQKSARRKRHEQQEARRSWSSPTVTIPSCAPHPALIRSCTFQSSPQLLLSTFATPQASTSRRKPSPLPRRMPTEGLFCRFSQSSLEPPTTDSRSPSFDSSSSRSTSVSSISPSTPVLSPVDHTHLIFTPDDLLFLNELFGPTPASGPPNYGDTFSNIDLTKQPSLMPPFPEMVF